MKDKTDLTLEAILQLISTDVKVIASKFQDTQLDNQTAQTLARYATTLANIKDIRQKETTKEKAELSKLSTEELIEMFNKTNTKKE